MIITLMTDLIILLTLFCAGAMVYKFFQQPAVLLSKLEIVKLVFSGIISFMADTLGVGSFAVNVALAKLLGTFEDQELPGVNNGAQVIPGAISSFFFMHWLDVDVLTLVTLVAGTAFGGLIGGAVVSRLRKQAIRLTMMFCFFGVIILLLAHQFRWFPLDGDLIELRSWKLVMGFFAMATCGMLTSAGVGLFAMVQGVLFVLGVSPLIAFPVMMTAGAMQQPLTTLVFLQQDKIPLKKTLILSVGGCIGVFITLPIFSHLTISWLHNLLLVILIYNFFAMGRAYLSTRAESVVSSQNDALTVYN